MAPMGDVVRSGRGDVSWRLRGCEVHPAVQTEVGNEKRLRGKGTNAGAEGVLRDMFRKIFMVRASLVVVACSEYAWDICATPIRYSLVCLGGISPAGDI